MKITDVDIQAIDYNPDDKLRGFASIIIDGVFVVRDIKIIEGNQGLFAAMPSRKITTGCPGCRMKNHLHARFCNQCGGGLNPVITQGERVKLHCDVAHPIDAATRYEIEQAILLRYREVLAAVPPVVATVSV